MAHGADEGGHVTVVDTSAAVANLLGEPTAGAIDAALARSDGAIISAATLVELGIVLEARLGPIAQTKIDRFLRDARIDVVPVDRAQVDHALEGWRRFGKGNHPAALNLGDCLSYALASATTRPVLCVGDDFARTDLEVVPLTEPPA